MDTPGMATAMVMPVIQGSRNKAVIVEDLEMRVRKAGQLAQQSRVKVKVIEASIHAMEIFHPRIRIIRPPPPPEPTTDGGFSLFSEVLLKAA